MQIKDYQCVCGSKDFFLSKNDLHVGIYCERCGKWFKWADKNEKNLILRERVQHN